MSNFTLKDFLKNQKETKLATVDSGLKSILDHKSESHERLFRLVLNLNTLALSGWVALAAWKPDAFETKRNLVFLASEFHVGSLVLGAVTEFLTLVHSAVSELYLYRIKLKWIDGYTTLEAGLVGAENTGQFDQAALADLANQQIKQLDDNLKDKTNKRLHLCINLLFSAGWIAGILCLGLFFYSIWFSVHAMVQFVSP